MRKRNRPARLPRYSPAPPGVCPRCRQPIPADDEQLSNDGLCSPCELDTHCHDCGEPIVFGLYGGLCASCFDTASEEEDDDE